jgi:hypothetical protein
MYVMQRWVYWDDLGSSMETHRRVNFFQILAGSHRYSEPGSSELRWRMLWVAMGSCVIAYASYLYFGSLVADARPLPVELVSTVKKGEHQIRGLVIVPSDCHSVHTRTEEVSASVFRLEFITQQESSRVCDKVATTREFNTVIFTPLERITLLATIDGESVPVVAEFR